MLENLSESAWFTKHLAAWCAVRLGAVFVLTVVFAVVLLLVLFTSQTGLPFRVAAAQCLSATLSSLLSLGVLHSWMAFKDYSQKAGEIDAEAQRLLKAGAADAFEAERALSEYQLLRASGPSIPTWVWKSQRDRLNQSWKDLKTSSD